MNRLESVAPETAIEVGRAGPQKQRLAAIEACRHAIEASKTSDEIVIRAFDLLCQDGVLPAKVRHALDDVADELDEKYMEIYQKTPDARHDYIGYFRRARTICAVSAAGGEDPHQAAIDAIYEARQTVDDQDGLCQVLSAYLRRKAD